MGMVSSCKQTPNMDPPKGLSIALGESYLLSHKSSSGGGGGGGSMKELWPLEENKYIFYFMVKQCLNKNCPQNLLSKPVPLYNNGNG